jgi:hypothetical protein
MGGFEQTFRTVKMARPFALERISGGMIESGPFLLGSGWMNCVKILAATQQ